MREKIAIFWSWSSFSGPDSPPTVSTVLSEGGRSQLGLDSSRHTVDTGRGKNWQNFQPELWPHTRKGRLVAQSAIIGHSEPLPPLSDQLGVREPKWVIYSGCFHGLFILSLSLSLSLWPLLWPVFVTSGPSQCSVLCGERTVKTWPRSRLIAQLVSCFYTRCKLLMFIINSTCFPHFPKMRKA